MRTTSITDLLKKTDSVLRGAEKKKLNKEIFGTGVRMNFHVGCSR